MGRDKALLEVNGLAMAQRVAEAMKQAGALETLAVGGNLQALRVEHADADVAVPVLATELAGGEAIDTRCQWLHAAWRRRAQPELRASFAPGERAVYRAVRDARLVVALVEGLDPAVLADADTPDDLMP